MPVCSYFLKGICSNSDCPYSHVYVSRKAEVCTDFLKGYCPLGAKVSLQALSWQPLSSQAGRQCPPLSCPHVGLGMGAAEQWPWAGAWTGLLIPGAQQAAAHLPSRW